MNYTNVAHDWFTYNMASSYVYSVEFDKCSHFESTLHTVKGKTVSAMKLQK